MLRKVKCDVLWVFVLVMLAGFPVGYAAAAPAYTPNVYAGANPAFPSGKSSHPQTENDHTHNI